jgi:hypothetical protein
MHRKYPGMLHYSRYWENTGRWRRVRASVRDPLCPFFFVRFREVSTENSSVIFHSKKPSIVTWSHAPFTQYACSMRVETCRLMAVPPRHCPSIHENFWMYSFRNLAHYWEACSFVDACYKSMICSFQYTNSNFNFTFQLGQGTSGTSIICPHNQSLSTIRNSKPYSSTSYTNFKRPIFTVT